MMELKLVLAGFMFAAVSQAADSALQVVIAAGAIAAGLLAIATLARRLYRFAVKVDKGVDLLYHLGERFDLLEQRVERVERKVGSARRVVPER